MAANLTPSEYRNNLVSSQEFKDRFTFPTQKIEIEARNNNSPGRAEYQLIIGNDADFQVQAITGTYAYHYASAAGLAFAAKAELDLTAAILDLQNTVLFPSQNAAMVAKLNNMIPRLQNFGNTGVYDGFFPMLISQIAQVQGILQTANGDAPSLNNISVLLIKGEALTAGAFTAPNPTANDGTDDLAIRMIDGKNSRLLTEGFCPLELILSPGAYGNPLRLLIPFNHIIQRNSFLRLELINYTPSPATVSLAFNGTKFFAA